MAAGSHHYENNKPWAPTGAKLFVTLDWLWPVVADVSFVTSLLEKSVPKRLHSITAVTQTMAGRLANVPMRRHNKETILRCERGAFYHKRAAISFVIFGQRVEILFSRRGAEITEIFLAGYGFRRRYISMQLVGWHIFKIALSSAFAGTDENLLPQRDQASLVAYIPQQLMRRDNHPLQRRVALKRLYPLQGRPQ